MIRSVKTVALTGRRSASRARLYGAIAMAAALIVAGVMAYRLPYFPGDIAISRWLQAAFGNSLQTAMVWVSYPTGDLPAMFTLLVCASIVWWRLGRVQAMLVLAAGLFVLVHAPIKGVIARPRPSSDLVSILATETSSSFPSGHSTFSMAVFGLLAYLAVVNIRQPIVRVYLSLFFSMLILATGFARIYLGVHWLSDVLGGYLLGGVLLLLLAWAHEHWHTRWHRRSGLS